MTWLALPIAIVLLAAVAGHVARSGRTARGPAEVPEHPAETGVSVLLCHRFVPEEAVSFRDERARDRVRLVGDHARAIGHRAYLQVHQVPRSSLIHRALRLGRSWPFTSLSCVLHGLPVPERPLTRPERPPEAWDVVELFEFADEAAASAFLSGSGAAAARAALAEDAGAWAERTHAVPLRSLRAFSREAPRVGSVVVLFFLRARSELGRGSMVSTWLGDHRRCVQTRQPLLEYERYDQLAALGTDPLEGAAAALSRDAGAPWDGVAFAAYGSMAELARGLLDPTVLATHSAVVHDETRFVDFESSSLVVGTVAGVQPARSPVSSPVRLEVRRQRAAVQAASGSASRKSSAAGVSP